MDGASYVLSIPLLSKKCYIFTDGSHTHTLLHRRFYTQTFFTHRGFGHTLLCTQAQTLLRTDAFAQTLLHTDAFTQTLLHADAFKHRCFEHTPLYTQRLLDTDTLTHRHFYTQRLSHPDAFAHRRVSTLTLLHTDAFKHRRFYTQTLLHTNAFTHTHNAVLCLKAHFETWPAAA